MGVFDSKGNPNPANAVNSLPIPNPQPPATPAGQQELNAMSAFARSNAGKKSFADTVFAGNTGGYFPGEGGSPGNPVSANRPKL